MNANQQVYEFFHERKVPNQKNQMVQWKYVLKRNISGSLSTPELTQYKEKASGCSFFPP